MKRTRITRVTRIIITFAIMILFTSTTVFTTPGLVAAEHGRGAGESMSTPSGIPYEQLGQEIDRFIEPFIGQSTPGAAIVITKDDDIIFSKGYGYANLEQKTPVDPAKTVFGFGSINKLFVWTSIMQLVEKGEMALDQDVRTYFPKSFADKLRADKPFTLLDMMSHTAGYEEYSGAFFTKATKKLDPLEDVLLSSQPEQTYEPGKIMSYSNFSTALAGYAVEKVSGESFSDYELKHILRPLGMDHTSGHPELGDRPELQKLEATGYGRLGSGKFEAREKHHIPFYPAGAMKGTAEDLARFAIGLTAADHPLFKSVKMQQTMLAQSYTPHPEMPSNAHGFWEYSVIPRTVGHSGGAVGFSSNFAIVPEERLGIVVLTNTEVEPDIVPSLVNKLIQNKKANDIVPGTHLPSSQDAAGNYVLSRNTLTTFQEIMGYMTRVSVKPSGEHDLTVTAMGRSGEYTQVSPNLYRLKNTKNKSLQMSAPYLYVEKDEKGKVVRLSGGQGMDMLPVKASRSNAVLLLSAVVGAMAVIFFAVTPVAMFIRWLIRRRKGLNSTASSLLMAAIVGCGTITAAMVLFLMATMITNPYAEVSLLNRCILINYFAATIAAICAAAAIWLGRKQALTRSQIWFRIVTAVIWIGFITDLITWKFFHIIS
ncbi:serine hydrolase domain-containing protein [Paenibacillus donghaensis]|uniref:serine hydrolase domain-containing protein n=1 Tax=Paenibacillus donghaensis TaxID=414771 RepID=UPI001D16970C|nr:serine hydrolase domain-containing protein [Paenibacillus donghaensis]